MGVQGIEAKEIGVSLIIPWLKLRSSYAAGIWAVTEMEAGEIFLSTHSMSKWESCHMDK